MLTRFERTVRGLRLFQVMGLLAVTTMTVQAAMVSGELKQWHKVTLTFTGPHASETGLPNPFRDYRLNVTFRHSSGRTLIVPGYFAADGDAENTSAVAGNKWRVQFSPDATGTWSYTASFRTGADVALSSASTAGTASSFDGDNGSFTVGATNKSGADFRGKGRLREVGQHYLQHAGTKEYFVKVGAGSPENFLAFAEFDNTTAGKRILHHYAPHAGHYRAGDPTWKGGKGKAIVGALNYLAAKRMNSLYFLTMNVGGDGDDVFPWTAKTERYRFDVSKLAQWEVVFEHMDQLGIHLHVVTQEQENDQLLDGGNLGPQRKLYYRELVARFGHHLGLTWNLGEETTNTPAQRDAYADYFNALDPYMHLIAVHTFPADRDKVYTPMLGHDVIGGASLQVQSPGVVHSETLKWVKKSAASGRKWVVAVDELGHASVGVKPDASDPTHSEIMHRVLWGSLLAGAGGVEWYFGYDYAHHDLTCEDWTTRENMWTLSNHAAQFVRDYLPLPLVANYNGITSSSVDYCLGKPGVAYAIYLPDGATTNISLPADETYSVHWFDPRSGGSLKTGTVPSVTGGGTARSVGRPPFDVMRDWVALLRRDSDADDPSTEPEQPMPMAVSDLVLIDAGGQTELRTLRAGETIDLWEDGRALNVRADAAGAVGSVVFFLNGAKYNTESSAPYAMAKDDDGIFRRWLPEPGSYTLRAVPYSGAGGTGAVGTPLEIYFTVISGASPPEPEPEPEVRPAVTALTLIDADTQQALGALRNGGIVDLGADGFRLNVRADTRGTVGSIVFYLNGYKFNTESAAPYAMAKDDDGIFRRWTPAPGNYRLRAVPYSDASGKGAMGTPLEISFTVVLAAPQPVPEPQPKPEPKLAVARLVLIDAATQRDLRTIANGDMIVLSEDGPALNMRAEVSGQAGSVCFIFDGRFLRTENTAPYALGADDSGRYRGWTPTVGRHTLRVIPYSRASRSGEAGQAMDLQFDVVR